MHRNQEVDVWKSGNFKTLIVIKKQYFLDIKWAMVFVVKLALTSNNLRKAIRYTWGNVKVYNEVMFETVFVIGDTTDETMKKSIAKENYLHGDILQLDLNERQK